MSTADRRAYWGRRYDQGLHGHAATDRDAWIEQQLANEECTDPAEGGVTVEEPEAGREPRQGARPGADLADFARAHSLVGSSMWSTSCACGGWPADDERDHLEHVLAEFVAGNVPGSVPAREGRVPAEQVAQIRARAEAATPGPWEVGVSVTGPAVTCDGDFWVADAAFEFDATHIASVDPGTVLALLADLDDARAALARVEALVESIPAAPFETWGVESAGPMETVDEQRAFMVGADRAIEFATNSIRRALGADS